MAEPVEDYKVTEETKGFLQRLYEHTKITQFFKDLFSAQVKDTSETQSVLDQLMLEESEMMRGAPENQLREVPLQEEEARWKQASEDVEEQPKIPGRNPQEVGVQIRHRRRYLEDLARTQ